MAPRIAVFGTGANGSCIAASMIDAGHDVTIIDQWPEHVETLRREGLTISMPDRTLHVNVRAHHLCDVCTFQEPFDVVLLAVKAYDTRWACEMIKPHVTSGGIVIGMQNCMVADVIRVVIGPERSIACVIELSSEMFIPGQVKRNTPPQKTWIGLGLLEGGPVEGLAEMQNLLRPVGKVEIKDNILAAKWTKLVVNAMCLGPFAMVGLTLLDAVKLPGMRDLIVEIGNEAMHAGQDLGYQLEPIFGLTPADLAGSNRPAELLFDTLASHIGPGRGRNTVLQDFLKNRPSEVSMINGLVAEENRKRGRPSPANARVAEIARAIESGRLKPSPDNMTLALSR
jgi:2-dehydropantoate 2-reductase